MVLVFFPPCWIPSPIWTLLLSIPLGMPWGVSGLLGGGHPNSALPTLTLPRITMAS